MIDDKTRISAATAKITQTGYVGPPGTELLGIISPHAHKAVTSLPNHAHMYERT